jgi:hypothetical protein
MFGGANRKSGSGLLNFFIIVGFLYYLVFQDFGIIADIIFSTNQNISEILDFFLFIDKNQQDLAFLDLGTEIQRNVTEQKETSFYYYDSPGNSRGDRAASSKKYAKTVKDFDDDDEDDDDNDKTKTSPYKWENLGIADRLFVIGISLAGGYLLACTVSVVLDFVFGAGTGPGSSGGGSGSRRVRRR